MAESEKAFVTTVSRDVEGYWSSGDDDDMVTGRNMCLMARKIVECDEVRDGKKILFWLDDWLKNGTLAVKFPSLYALDKRKSCLLGDRWVNDVFSWAWKRKPNNSQELLELKSILDVTRMVVRSNGPDTWRSRLTDDGFFRVCDLRALIDSKLTTPINNPTVWLHLVPIKCINFVWRACLGRIPTAVALSRRGINISSISYQMCFSGVDTADHILLDCPIAFDSLSWIFNWCDVSIQRFLSISDFVNFAASWGNCPKKRKIFIAICYGFLWCMWKARNDVWFNKIQLNSSKLADNVISMVFSWLKSRGNFENCR
ncbi:uncharacterized protein LOC111884805 [Lactuca sativa]|uniref:uncharacterized protein LOC111884805 n=1 Tax=Lactuca sativa TaxID=4236 RepID=UPI000CD8D1CC|nr:uncharacterized protein LOC111884805 [Lactuca sativa]